jgi:hypothetical protein
MLYRIEFQGKCQNGTNEYNFSQRLIDGRMLIEIQLLLKND